MARVRNRLGILESARHGLVGSLALLCLSDGAVDAREASVEACREAFGDETTYDTGFRYLYDCVGVLSEALTELEARTVDQPPQTEFVKPEMYGPGWSTYSGYRNFEYGKDALGRVHLRGLMAGCPSTDRPIFRLPGGYRPKVRLIFTSIGNGNALARVDIRGAGEVYYWWTDGASPCPGWLTLDGVSFQAEE